MIKSRVGNWSLLTAGMLLAFVIGCSASGTNAPIVPDEGAQALTESPSALPTGAPMTEGHGTWGHYIMQIDERDMSINIVPDRSSDAHFDVTWVRQMCPTCITAKVTNFDPNTRTFWIELHTKNPTKKTGRDVRFIIDLDGTGEFDFLDPDNYTKLHDVDSNVNPFRALAKTQPGRAFIPGANMVDKLMLYISASHVPVTNIPFIIDVSYSARCEEPYMMKDIKITGQFPPGGGGSVVVDLVSYDSQKNWGKVFLRTGGLFTPTDIEMTMGANVGTDGKKYSATFSNTVGGASGLVPILIEAYNVDLTVEPMPLNDYARIFADPGEVSAIAGEVFNALTKQAANNTVITIDNMGGGADPLPFTVTDGTYYVPVLAGNYYVKAVHTNYFLQDTLYDVVVPPDTVVYVCFGMAPKYLDDPADALATISGHIRNSTNGEPIPGAQATLDGGPSTGGVIQARVVDENGHYCFWAVPTAQQSNWTVHAFHPDYIPQDLADIQSQKNKTTPQVDFDLVPLTADAVWRETFEAGPSNVGTLHDWTFDRVVSGAWPGGSSSQYHNTHEAGDILWHVQDPSSNPVQDIFYINGECLLPSGDATSGWIPGAYEGHRYMWYGEQLDNTPANATHSGSFIDEWSGVVYNNGGTSSNPYNAGTAKTGPIDLTGYTDLTLTLQSYWEIEAVDPSIQFDAMDVLISTDGTTWTLLDRLNPLAEPIPDSGNAQKAYTSAGYNMAAVWSPSVINISSYAGNANVYLRFDFDTIDSLYNGFRGWIVDDITIWPYVVE
jgi:hypothetical protein